MSNSSPQAPIEVIDLHEFVKLLVGWHNTKVAVLRHMMDLPTGTEMSVDDGESIVLHGESLTGFRAGLQLALMEVGSLPFMYEQEEQGKEELPQPTNSTSGVH